MIAGFNDDFKKMSEHLRVRLGCDELKPWTCADRAIPKMQTEVETRLFVVPNRRSKAIILYH